MGNKIALRRAELGDIDLMFQLQVKAFTPLYEKYHDDSTSPVKESKEKMQKKIAGAKSDYYVILNEEIPIGGIRVSHHRGQLAIKNVAWISPLYIIPEYQNRGIAQEVLRMILAMYSNTISWRLDTIKQEAGNCHLYEKCGFVRVGTEEMINDKMSLIKYEKSMIVPRRFRKEDAEGVSKLITRNFIEVNSKDYGLSAMQKLADEYNAQKVLSIADFSHMYVFEWKDEIVGVGSISSFWGSKTESILLTIFVLPKHHGKGIGRKIIHTLEQDILYKRASRIEIPASTTGTEFYRKFGYDYKNGIKELDEEGHYRLEKYKEAGV